MQRFTDLEAWKNGLLLVQEVYSITQTFPREEIYGMTAQLRRSSTSILANIAEGSGRFTYPDKAAKYVISRGESSETEALLLIAVALKFVTEEKIHQALQCIHRERALLSGLIAACRKRS